MHERCGVIVCEFCRAFFTVTCRGRFSDIHTAWHFIVRQTNLHNILIVEQVLKCGQCLRVIGCATTTNSDSYKLFNIIVNNGLYREEFLLREVIGQKLIVNNDCTVAVATVDTENQTFVV